MSYTAGAVAFSFAAFAAQYPALARNVPPEVAEAQWNVAGVAYLRNNASSPVQDPARRAVLLNMVTAHLCILNAPDRIELVGRLSSAGEGSVNVSANWDAPPGSHAWFTQTAPGAQFWQATQSLTTGGLYVRGNFRWRMPF